MRYYDRTFDLSRLDSVDLIAVYWMGDAIAHVMITFGFQEKDFVTFSIETRKEIGEGYSTLKGFFKQYESIFIAGDERDLIRVRTDYRNPTEDVYLYRTRMPPETARKFFMEYVQEINSLKQHAQWYNTLTSNCTVDIIRLIRDAAAGPPTTGRCCCPATRRCMPTSGERSTPSIPYEELRKSATSTPGPAPSATTRSFPASCARACPRRGGRSRYVLLQNPSSESELRTRHEHARSVRLNAAGTTPS